MTRRWLIAAWTVVGLAVVNIAMFAFILLQPPTPDPLGDYPIQQVLAVTAVDVTVEGTKCADYPLRFTGTSTWSSISESGLSFPKGAGVRDHPGGCETRVFVNPFPPEVLARPGVWHIVGTDCPIDQTGKVIGLCRTWETENFTVG